MFRAQLFGTPSQLEKQIRELKLPDELPGHDTIRAYALLHIPKYEVTVWQVNIMADSAINTGGNRIVGFMTVSSCEP